MAIHRFFFFFFLSHFFFSFGQCASSFSFVPMTFCVYLPFIFSFCFFLITLYINSLVQVWADRNSPYWLPALPDIGHKLLPYFTFYSINNYYLLASFVLVIIRYIFQRDIRLIVLRRWLFLQAVLFIMRSISIFVTSLSVPLPGCNTTAVGSPPIEAFYIMSLVHATCGDVLFSGHTVTCELNSNERDRERNKSFI